jgi:peptidoglycan hydrolase-like protein with peptidoglycan-binding domain
MKKIILLTLLTSFFFVLLIGFVSFSNSVNAQNIGSLTNIVSSGFSFKKDLRLGDTDPDVKNLQKVLNADIDTIVALEGDGSFGKETTYFGNLTKNAVIKFQNKYKDIVLTLNSIVSADGFVNKATRTRLNLLLGVMNTYDSVGLPQSRAGSGAVSAQNTPTPVYIPPAVVSAPISQNQMSICAFANFLQSVQIINSTIANNARNLFGCQTVAVDDTNNLVPSVDIRINNSSNTVTVATPRNVTISWTSKNVTSCATPAGPKPLSGSVDFYADSSGTFPITCTGPYGTVSDSINVIVGTNSLFVSCSANPTSTTTNSIVKWEANAEGVSGPYSYFWSGDFSGNSKIINKSYTQAGIKYATVKVTAGSLSATASCAVSINTPSTIVTPITPTTPTTPTATTPLNVQCASNLATVPVGTPVNWYGTVSGGTNNNVFSWSSLDGLSGNTQFVSKTYSSAGYKSATFSVNSGTEIKTATCSIIISPASPFVNPIVSSNISGPADVEDIIGYGIVNNWMNIDSVSLAAQLASNGLTTTHIELLGYAKDNYYDNPSVLYPKLKTFINNMRAKGIVVFINIVNWNKGAGVSENGTVSICESKYNDVWFTGIVDYLIDEVGMESIILQAASEWSGGRNSSCDSKAQQWENIVQTKWTGMKSSNKGTRPSSPVKSGWFFEYHPCSATDLGADGSIVTTDCGGILSFLGKGGDMRGLADITNLQAYACKVISSEDKGFLYYGFGHSQIDSQAIMALGQIVSNPNLCESLADIDLEALEEELEEELLPDPKTDVSGLVTRVTKCLASPGEFDLTEVEIIPCGMGQNVQRYEPDAMGNMLPSGSFSGNIFITLRNNVHTAPAVGDLILARVVPDGAGTCSELAGNIAPSTYSYEGIITGQYESAPDETGACTVDGGGGGSNSWWVPVRDFLTTPVNFVVDPIGLFGW